MASARPTWWLAVDGQSYGPYDLRAMQAYIAEGRVTGESIVCRVGDQSWTPARADTLLFRAGTPQAPPYAGGAAPPGAAAPVLQDDAGGVAPDDGAPPRLQALGAAKKAVVAVLGAALVVLFFLPWVNLMMIQGSGYDLVRLLQAMQQWGAGALPGQPGQRVPVQVDLGWRAYQFYLLYLIPLAGCAAFATALAGLRLWRVAAIACGVVVWGIVALGAVQVADMGMSWADLRESLRYVSYGAYGTLVVATALTIVGFTRG